MKIENVIFLYVFFLLFMLLMATRVRDSYNSITSNPHTHTLLFIKRRALCTYHTWMKKSLILNDWCVTLYKSCIVVVPVDVNLKYNVSHDCSRFYLLELIVRIHIFPFSSYAHKILTIETWILFKTVFFFLLLFDDY